MPSIFMSPILEFYCPRNKIYNFLILMSITLNKHAQSATCGSVTSKLTRLEYALLAFLIDNANRICPRDEILQSVWGTRFQYDTGTIDVHLNAIRRKLQLSADRPIETFRGVGLCYHSDQPGIYYIFNLRTMVIDWMRSHENEFKEKELIPQLHLDPFVSEVREHPDTFRRMMDAILYMLLPTAQPGYIRISTKLSITHFSFVIDINGTVNTLKIPIVCR